MIDDLERRLRDLGDAIAYPQTPALATSVRARLELGARRRVTRWRLVIAACVAAAAVVFGVPPVRTAIAHWLGIPGVVITPVQSPPATASGPGPSATPFGGIDVGVRTTLGRAGAIAGFPVVVPSGLGPPDEVFVRSDLGPVVTLIYRPRSGLPDDRHAGIGLLVTEFRGATDQELIQKTVGPGTTVGPVTVAGEPGFWISGTPHEIAYRLPDGSIAPDSLRLSGSTLAFQRGPLTIRLEGGISEGDALALAASLR